MGGGAPDGVRKPQLPGKGGKEENRKRPHRKNLAKMHATKKRRVVFRYLPGGVGYRGPWIKKTPSVKQGWGIGGNGGGEKPQERCRLREGHGMEAGNRTPAGKAFNAC